MAEPTNTLPRGAPASSNRRAARTRLSASSSAAPRPASLLLLAPALALLLLLLLCCCCQWAPVAAAAAPRGSSPSLPRRAQLQASPAAGGTASLPSLASYARAQQLSPDFALHWTVEGSGSSASVRLALHARTAGWVGFGISEVGAMVGSDAMVGWVDSSNASAPVAFLTDRFLFNKSWHSEGVALDRQQDLRLLGAQQQLNASSGDTWTTLHLQRLLDTGDCNDRAIVPGQAQYFIWAIGTSSTLFYHGVSRGAVILTLAPAPPSILAPPPPSTTTAAALPSAVRRRAAESASGISAAAAPLSAGHNRLLQQQPPAPPATFAPVAPIPGEGKDSRRLQFLMDGFEVPTNSTTYQCKAFELSDITEKTHIVEYEFAANGTTNSTLHHALLYACQGDQAKYIPAGDTFDCLIDNYCWVTVAVWALGGLPIILPDVAGLPIGPGYPTQFVLQVHYTNPSGTAGIVDNSGFSFRLADRPRPEDAGFMLLGPVDYHGLIRIPSGEPAWTQTSVCPAQASEALLRGTEGVTVVASMNHLHTLGRQLFTEVHRNGSVVATIHRQDY